MTEDVNKTILKTDIENGYLKTSSVHSEHALRVAGSSATYMCKYLQQMVPPFTASIGSRQAFTNYHISCATESMGFATIQIHIVTIGSD